MRLVCISASAPPTTLKTVGDSVVGLPRSAVPFLPIAGATRIGLPIQMAPFIVMSAALRSGALPNVTKPNPLLEPVFGSTIILLKGMLPSPLNNNKMVVRSV